VADAVPDRARKTWRPPLSPAGWLSLPVLLFLLLPILVVVPMSLTATPSLRFPPSDWSLRWYGELLASPDWRAATLRSAAAGLCAALIAAPTGIAVALVLRTAANTWATLIRVWVLLPLLVPSVLLGIGVLFLYARLGLNNSFAGLVLAHAALALPFVVVTVEAGLMQLDPALALAARSLGAGYMTMLATVTLPLIRGSVTAAALFAFLTSFDEISIAFFISSGDASTLPRRMFGGLRDSFDPTIAAISTLLILLTTTVIGAALLFDRRGAGQGGAGSST
jgi:putative spermidine/putrescine transport system permease protein